MSPQKNAAPSIHIEASNQRAVPDDRLIDRFGRRHDSLRISVTDRCNLRCFYCMPDGPLEFLDESKLLNFDQITRIARVLSRVGVRKLRLTGGEPLMRPRIDELVASLAAVEGIHDLALTTNGMMLDRWAKPLRRAGLQRLNISLDTLNEEMFKRISRRTGLNRVLSGIDAALDAGFSQLRLNALAIKDVTEPEIIALTEFARERNLQIRFIEYMPLDADHQWQRERVLSGDEILTRLAERYGPLQPAPRTDASQPAEDYLFLDGRGGIGIIRPVTQPFCESCNRLRLTAEGTLRNCLFSLEEWDLRPSPGEIEADEILLQRVRECLSAKKAGHLISQTGFEQPQRAMYQIGG